MAINLLKLLLPVLMLAGTLSAPAGAEEEDLSGKVRSLAEGATSPPATIDQLAFLYGHWRGEAFGGVVEDMFSPASDTSIIGHFQLVNDGQPQFYELTVFVEENGTLVHKVKHFNPDFTGWEEKGESVIFPLVAIEGDTFYFDGYTLEKISDTEIVIYVKIESRDSVSVLPFHYKKVSG